MSNRNYGGQDQILTLNHEIRILEHFVEIAKRRRKWSNLSLAFGPILLVALYAMLWIAWIPEIVKWAVFLPALPIAIGFGIASFYLKTHPGGPVEETNGRRFRKSEGDLELDLARGREVRKARLASGDVSTKIRRVAYREDAANDIEEFRTESRRHRRVSNVLQGVIIIGSLAATGAAGVAAELEHVRWAILAITFVVGISSGFMGYFKYKERSFYLQQTADAIEHESEALKIGVGRYKGKPDDEALADFVEEVHRLKSEQMKRQQNLEQPPEARHPAE